MTKRENGNEIRVVSKPAIIGSAKDSTDLEVDEATERDTICNRPSDTDEIDGDIVPWLSTWYSGSLM